MKPLPELLAELEEKYRTSPNLSGYDRKDTLALLAVIEKLIEFSDDMIEARWADTYKNQKWNRKAVEKDKTERDQYLAQLLEERTK